MPSRRGRKPLKEGEKAVKIGISLPPDLQKALADLGRGNVSKGIRVLWEKANAQATHTAGKSDTTEQPESSGGERDDIR